jgi:hypothetical protein
MKLTLGVNLINIFTHNLQPQQNKLVHFVNNVREHEHNGQWYILLCLGSKLQAKNVYEINPRCQFN